VSNLVEIRDVEFGYAERSILSGLQMDFPRGKVVAVMGGSGSGKTTILRLIGGQIRARSGSVKVDGQPVNDLDKMHCSACAVKWACCFSTAHCSPI
jgi:phospholipid/cholesterol/gamma-HCH transport system ATP-binding protein